MRSGFYTIHARRQTDQQFEMGHSALADAANIRVDIEQPQLYLAVSFAQKFSYGIHPNTAAGDIARLFFRGKARVEY